MFGVTFAAENLSFMTLQASVIFPTCLFFNGVVKISLASKWQPMSKYVLPRDDLYGKRSIRSVYALLVDPSCVM